MPRGVYERTKIMGENISKALKGRKFSEEHKRILSESHKGHKGWNKNLTKETDERIAKMARKASETLKEHYAKMTKEERKKHMLPSIKARQEQWIEMTKEERREFCQHWFEAGIKASQKRWDNMTKEEKREYMLPAIKAMKEKWAKMTKEERRECCKSWQKAGMKAGIKATQKKFAKMTKEERKEAMLPMTLAAQKASKERFAKMTKGERRRYMHPAIKAAQKANPSSIERDIWEVLDKFSISYETQVSFNNGHFIVDIYIPKQRLIVECNGDYWHNLPERKERDKRLRNYAKNNNYKLVELPESKIKEDPEQAFLNGLKNLES